MGSQAPATPILHRGHPQGRATRLAQPSLDPGSPHPPGANGGNDNTRGTTPGHSDDVRGRRKLLFRGATATNDTHTPSHHEVSNRSLHQRDSVAGLARYVRI